MKIAPVPAWLDEATSALVEETVRMLIKRHARILLAIILLGSVASRTMQTWDSMFLDNLARDGIVLYARGSLPAPLAARQSFQRVLEDQGITH